MGSPSESIRFCVNLLHLAATPAYRFRTSEGRIFQIWTICEYQTIRSSVNTLWLAPPILSTPAILPSPRHSLPPSKHASPNRDSVLLTYPENPYMRCFLLNQNQITKVGNCCLWISIQTASTFFCVFSVLGGIGIGLFVKVGDPRRWLLCPVGARLPPTQ